MRPYRHGLLVLLIVLVALGGPTPSGAIARGQAAAKREVLQLKHLHKLQHKSQSVINFWHNRGHWALFTNHEKCWQIEAISARQTCRFARKSLAAHAQRLMQVKKKLERLNAPHDTGYLLPIEAMKLGQRMAALKGWNGNQWSCLKQLWGPLESSWSALADNPRSEAYGIPQALPGRKMLSAGAGWLTSAYVQIKWGLGYIKDRYHTPCGALAFRLANHYY